MARLGYMGVKLESEKDVQLKGADDVFNSEEFDREGIKAEL